MYKPKMKLYYVCRYYTGYLTNWARQPEIRTQASQDVDYLSPQALAPIVEIWAYNKREAIKLFRILRIDPSAIKYDTLQAIRKETSHESSSTKAKDL